MGYTYIFSPEQKEFTAGVSWGNFWLNGEKLTGIPDPSKPFRNNVQLKLNPGWNLLFTRQQILWGSLHTLLALPANSGLVLSPYKKMSDDVAWKIAGPLSPKENSFTGNPVEPVNEPEKLKLNWKHCGPADGMANPARELAWLEVSKHSVDPYRVAGLEVPAGEEQAFVFDFGGIHLGRLFIDAEAPEGTVFDLTWSEDLRDSLVTLYKRTQINAVARFISRAGKQHFETFKPYGLRYLQVTVRNHCEPVSLEKAGIIRQEYPFVKRGSFECSDPLMNDIWEMGWRSLRVCAEDSYTDTPFRERGHYAGDLFPQFALTMATAGDPLLASYQVNMYAAFHEMAFLAGQLGKTEDALKYRKWAEETATMIRKKFWDPEKGNFYDGIKDGKTLETRFPGSSTYPSLWGITTPEQDLQLTEYFADALINIGPPVNRKQQTTPYGGFYALASLYRKGNALLAEEFIRKHWGKMVLEANDLTWEDFNRSDHSTMSHAWSASPTYYLSSEALGVNLGFPLQLNPDTIYIMPQTETLEWARGTVPHPRGDVWVDWRIDGRNLYLEYKAPAGTPVVVTPRGRLATYNLKVNTLE